MAVLEKETLPGNKLQSKAGVRKKRKRQLAQYVTKMYSFPFN